jgi:hypothetical protein
VGGPGLNPQYHKKKRKKRKEIKITLSRRMSTNKYRRNQN